MLRSLLVYLFHELKSVSSGGQSQRGAEYQGLPHGYKRCVYIILFNIPVLEISNKMWVEKFVAEASLNYDVKKYMKQRTLHFNLPCYAGKGIWYFGVTIQ